MAVEVIDPFDGKMPFPLDLRNYRTTAAARDAIPTNERWEGMAVYVQETESWWFLKGGILNENWVEVTGEPTGPAGGDLSGSYPNPQLEAGLTPVRAISLTTQHLDTLTTPGYYYASSISGGLSLGYPINSFSGSLQIYGHPIASDRCSQVLRMYNQTADQNKAWQRSIGTNGVWSSWVELTSGSEDSSEWGNISGNIEDQEDLILLLNSKQDELTQGTGIDITGTTISSTITDPSVYGLGDGINSNNVYFGNVFSILSTTFLRVSGAATNLPIAATGYLRCYYRSENQKSLEYISDTGRVFINTQQSGSWHGWRELASMDDLDDALDNKIDVGNVLPSDLGLTEASGIPIRASNGEWIERSMSTPPVENTIPLRTAGLGASGGRVKTNDAIQDDDAVPLGQLTGGFGLYHNEETGNISWGITEIIPIDPENDLILTTHTVPIPENSSLYFGDIEVETESESGVLTFQGYNAIAQDLDILSLGRVGDYVSRNQLMSTSLQAGHIIDARYEGGSGDEFGRILVSTVQNGSIDLIATGSVGINNEASNETVRIDSDGGGLKYDGDYSQGFTERSLVDKEYVDTRPRYSTIVATTGNIELTSQMAGGIVYKTGGGTMTVTIPTHAVDPIPIGSEIKVIIAEGEISETIGGTVTIGINQLEGNGSNGSVNFIKIDEDLWVVLTDITQWN